MKRISGPRNKPRQNRIISEYSLSLLACIVMSVVGAAGTLPFIFEVFLTERHHPTWWTYFTIVMVLIFLPMMIWGMIAMWVKKSTRPTSNLEIDVARARFAAEMHLMRDIMKDSGGKRD